jgi:hypothetical protein
MIAEREGYHSRIFERPPGGFERPECKAQITDGSGEITEKLGDAKMSDKQKLLYITSLAPDPEAFFKPFCDFVETIKDDLEAKELFGYTTGRIVQPPIAACHGVFEERCSNALIEV